MKKLLLLIVGVLLLSVVSSLAGPIHEAVESSDLAKISSILANNPGCINEKDSRNNGPLHLAAINGNLEVVKLLISKGADIDLGDNENSSPLINAAVNRHFEIVKLLVEKGANVNLKDDNGTTPMHFAAIGGNQDIIKYLIEKGAEVNAVNNSGLTPMIYASYRGQVENINFMLAHGADMNLATTEGMTNLHGAANNGSVETCRLFLDRGMDVNVKSKDGRTPIFDAASRGRVDAVRFLLERGARADATNNFRITPLHEAAAGGNVEVINMILQAGMDIDVVDSLGRTPLHWTQFNPQIEVIQTLLTRGANPNHKNTTGRFPLYMATLHGSQEICQILLDNGADVNQKEDVTGQSCLHLACIKGYDNIIDQLLAKNADLNARDKNGNTPLAYAVKYGNNRLAKMLITKGAADDKIANQESNWGAKELLNKPLAENEAVVWYTGHSGWTIKTKNHLLVFDYWQNGPPPTEPSLSNGNINPAEIKDLPVTVFVSHRHQDHYSPAVFSWKETVPDITYVFGFEPDSVTGYEYMAPREERNFDGVKVTTIESNDSGVGFLVETDGMVLYHPGDHANRQRDFSGPFKPEIDYLAAKNVNIDLTFAPVSGCGFGDLEAVKLGVYYTIETLSPKIVFPQHSMGGEYRYKEFAEEAAAQNLNTTFICAENRGDRYLYRNGTMAF